MPACAITIHKSQGGTFNELVYKYSTQQQQQLVYVALSRVTRLQDLYITTENDVPLRFLHGRRGSDVPAMREIRDEFRRLGRHILPTVTTLAQSFCNNTAASTQILILNLNVQSLRAHAGDIETDSVIQRCDYLALSETWMRDDEELIDIHNYECVTRINSHTSTTTNAAGGVAIYKHIFAKSSCRRLDISVNNQDMHTRTFGDICLAEVFLDTDDINLSFVLGSVYIHPGTTMQNIRLLLYQALLPYINNPSMPYISDDSDIALVLCGDFNINVIAKTEFLRFIKDAFNLNCVSNTLNPTTLGGTCLDITFTTRNITAETLPFISYFSYHRPILNRLYTADGAVASNK